MRPLMHVRHRANQNFQVHQMQSMFALVATMTLAGLIMVALLLTMAH